MINRKARILIVEDEKGDADLMVRAITKTGIALPPRVIPDYENGLHEVQSEYYHLLLLDLNLHGKEPYDPESFEGLWLLQDLQEMGLGNYLPVIVLTKYGTEQTAKEAFRKFKVIDFISKRNPDEFNESYLPRRLKQVFKEELEINLGLDIEFKNGLDWERLLGPLLHRSDRPIPAPTREQAEDELVDLFCKLFHSADKIKIAPLEPGHSEAGIVKAAPYKNGHRRGDVVAKYGDSEQLERESDNFDKYVQPYMQGARRTQKQDFRRTLRLGGIVYTLIGAGGEKICDFNSYYSQEDDLESIKTCLSNLFNQTCSLWYENRQDEREHEFMEMYSKQLDLTAKKLERAFRFKFSAEYVEERQFGFKGIEGVFGNPVMAFCEGRARFEIPTHLCITHGDLNGSNILIDSQRNTWLIDFYWTDWGHCLRDFVELETVIKFQLTSGKDLNELYNLEKALLSPTEFGEEVSLPKGVSEEILKATEIISHLRNIAGMKVKPRKSLKEYYAGLFYQTINLLRFHKLIKRRVRKNHVLLSASMLYEKLQVMA